MFFKKQQNTETARVIDWKTKWSTGAPLPQVFSNGRKVYLIYYIDEPDPNWDGTYVTQISNTSETKYPLALVEFTGGTFRFGIAGDEVISGLPLYGKGLSAYEAHLIENSQWIKELKAIHSVHPYYNEDRWRDLKHYMLLFHDEILEVIASGFIVETHNTTFKELGAEVIRRMNS